MRVIPVLDLLRGEVVRGVAGRRTEYRPIVSQLGCDAQPMQVAQALRTAFGFEEMYVADIDAIEGREPHWDVYRALLAERWRVWLDVGLNAWRRAQQLADLHVAGHTIAGVIVGLESLPHFELLRELLKLIGPERLVFSLDLKQGQPLTSQPAWQSLAPLDIARQVLDLGVRRWIVLDLAGVGVSGGINTLPLCTELRQLVPTIELITGGGVRGLDDLAAARAAGCNGVLVASALHDGRLSVANLRAH